MASNELINTGWLLACSALVFIMQVGFCCLESGLVRTKNSINVAMKNLVDLCLAGTLFWFFGYALMFGRSDHGWFGTSGFLFDSDNSGQILFFLFQLMFCGAATTIVSGAVAERMRFRGYLVTAVITAGFLYPLFGHWAWGADGWLAGMGFHDFAGSTIVHSVGGWVALAACLIIGPRIGRFDSDRRHLIGHNLPLATIGVMLLWFGWFGFNGGSGLVLDASVPAIVTATVLAAMAGGIAALTACWTLTRRADILKLMNGVLGGLVAVTACCNVVSLSSAMCVGAIGGIIAFGGDRVLEKLKIDDVVGAVPVHGFCGVWGTIAVALFAREGGLNTGLDRWEQLGVQCLGAAVCFVWTFGIGYLILRLVNYYQPLRVAPDAEEAGLNIAEHDATTEIYELVTEMDQQRLTGDFSRPVSIASFSEIGQVAQQYNEVLAFVNWEREELVRANRFAKAANADLQMAQVVLEEKLREVAEFNEVAVDRELRMIELKQEINSLCEQAGHPPKYDLTLGDVTEAGA